VPAKTLLYDIEVSPNVSYTWGGKYEVDVIQFVQPWYMLSFAYKWLGEKKTYAYSLPMLKGYKQDKKNDLELCRKLWELMSEADILCGHNQDGFDQKMSYARFVKHGFAPPAPSETIDTLKIARKHFKFSSNKLDDLGKYLDVGKKLAHHGFDTWLGCMERDDPKSWNEMVLYNKRDVELLERVYLKLAPYMNSSPNVNVYQDTILSCPSPSCGKPTMIRNGFKHTVAGKKQRWQCTTCGRWATSPKAETAVIR
jgi:hypothetical protein